MATKMIQDHVGRTKWLGACLVIDALKETNGWHARKDKIVKY